MQILCPHCQEPLEVDEQWAGQQVDCPQCGHPLEVPAPKPAMVEKPTAARSLARHPSRPVGGSRPPASGGGGAGKWLLLVAVVLAAGAFGSACLYFHAPPAQVWRMLTDYVRSVIQPPPPAPVPTPAPAPSATPTPPVPTPEATATPAPTAPAATPPPDPVAWLLGHKPSWPREIALTAAATFPILSEGRRVGEGSVPAGTTVRLLQIEPATGSVVVSYEGYGNSTCRVPVADTDLRPRAAAAMAKSEADEQKLALAPAATATPAVPTAESSPPPFAVQPAGQPTLLTDEVIFGDERSEKAHDLKAQQSEVERGALEQSSRRLLPGGAEPWEGGKVSFKTKIDGHSPAYLTIKFWGGEANTNRLILYCEGKQVGYRHLGDVDLLDDGGSDEPPSNGRFYYVTTPLPVGMTRGKSELHVEIRSTGRIFAYGTTFDDFQRKMEGPTRGLYRVYTHSDPCFVPPAEEKQGTPPPAPRRAEPGEEVFREMKQHLVHTLDGQLAADHPLSQMQALMLARAYHMKWSPAYHHPKAVEQIVRSVDALYAGWKKDAKSMLEDKNTPNPGWFAAGPAGEAMVLLGKALEPSLDQKVAGDKTRRAQWLELFVESRDWLRFRRKLYTNQSMIVDLNIYRSNRAVAALDAKQAMPEDRALHYLYESLGLQPWLGSDTAHGPEKPMGDDYFQLTAKGLTKELGYVGNYGEVLDWLDQIYNATRPQPGQPGDPKILAQVIKITRARAAFRYPAEDEDGKRAMRLETAVGWRDTHLPGEVVYNQIGRRDGSPLDTAAITLDPQSVGAAQQMFTDNQFFASLREMLKKRGPLDTLGMLAVPDAYETLRAQKTSPSMLPMAAGQPDFVFSDEEDGVVALKNGGDILYVSLYWRARSAVNFLARVHYITPSMERIATVREETQFIRSGKTWKRADDILCTGLPWVPRYPVNTGSAEAGEELPIAQVPRGIEYHEGDESVYAGKGDFYLLRYGPYLIGMNLTKSRDFELPLPAGLRSAKELVSGKTVSLGGNLKVGPKSTVVVYTGPLPGERTMQSASR